ncbi:unnamed protein product [Cuscuta campestris]|uniref:Bifunctional inhibitor/plant lipid transfer protein/seed storage helical domain-containing protein n=1 Tax=Cuscuta campestris TaxID=132261 RepID=A0A484LL95_9ASTE|nr:unnamed protein product [Cuscuta campestris]
MEARFARLETLIVSTCTLDKLIDLLENVLYGEIDLDEGVCGVYDHVDELIKTLRLFRHTTGQPNYDSDLYAFDVEISCSIQDMVRGPPILPSLIPWELQNFRTNMLGCIKILIDTPPYAPNVVSTAIEQNAEAQNHASKEELSVDSQVGEEVDIVPEAINKDDGGSNVVEKNEGSLAEDDVANVDEPDSTFHEFYISAGVAIAKCDVLNSVDKVADAYAKQAHSPMLIDTITLFKLVDVVKTEHLISTRATTYVLLPISSFHHFAPRSKMTSKLSSSPLLLLSMLFISSFTTPISGCGGCGDKRPPTHHKPPSHGEPGLKPPGILPPIITKPPGIGGGVGGIVPPVTLPPVTLPPVTTLPPVVTPITNPPYSGSGKPCPTPPSPATCPIDALKLGGCVDIMGGLIHIGLGDPAVNECCPVLNGLLEVEAAACLCTTLKIKALNLNIYVPLALQLLVTCGKTPPPGYTCSL